MNNPFRTASVPPPSTCRACGKARPCACDRATDAKPKSRGTVWALPSLSLTPEPSYRLAELMYRSEPTGPSVAPTESIVTKCGNCGAAVFRPESGSQVHCSYCGVTSTLRETTSLAMSPFKFGMI